MGESYVQRYREIDGIASPVPVTNGPADQQVELAYLLQVQNIARLYDPVQTPSPSSNDVNQLLAAVALLKTIATTSQIDDDNNSATPLVPAYLASDMVDLINLLSRSLRATGINSSSDTDAMKRWQDLQEVGAIIQRAILASTINKSLGSLIQNEYIAEGNRILFEQFSGLEVRLRLAKDSLTVLGQVQYFHNQVRPLDVDEIPSLVTTGPYAIVGVPSGSDAAAWEPKILTRVSDKINQLQDPYLQLLASRAGFYKNAYQELANEMLKSPEGIPVKVVFNGKTGDATVDDERGAVFSSLTELRVKLLSDDVYGELKRQIVAAAEAERGVTFTVDQIDLAANTALYDISTNTTGIKSGSIEEKLRAVYNDIKNIDSDEKLNKWLVDNVNTHVDSTASVLAGDIQRRITEAIVVNQNNNDQASQQLRQTMFLFETFYDSANNMIQKIKTIIINMAKNIITRG